jgi:hypothetical protein
LPHIELFCFSGQVCIFLQGNANVRRLEFWYRQIAFVKDKAESRYNIPVSINALTRAFDCPRSRVQTASRTGWTNRTKEESISPSTKIVNNKSWTGFNTTQNKTHHSREERRNHGLLYVSIQG